MFEQIIVCVDGSENAKRAAKVGEELALRYGSKVVLMNVINPLPALTSYEMAMTEALGASELNSVQKEDQSALLCESFLLFEKAGIHCRLRGETGHTVNTILSVVEEEKADLIILGSRGLGGFQRLLLGSVSDGVLHHARCAVLVVR